MNLRVFRVRKVNLRLFTRLSAALEAGRAPVDELDRALSLDRSNLCCDEMYASPLNPLSLPNFERSVLGRLGGGEADRNDQILVGMSDPSALKF